MIPGGQQNRPLVPNLDGLQVKDGLKWQLMLMVLRFILSITLYLKYLMILNLNEDVMNNQIIITKIWQDIHMQQFRLICKSSNIDLIAEVYICHNSIEQLTRCMSEFLKCTKHEQIWYNGGEITQTIPYLSIAFKHVDSKGHVTINVSIHDHDKNLMPYSSSFSIITESGALGRFAQEISHLPTLPINATISLY